MGSQGRNRAQNNNRADRQWGLPEQVDRAADEVGEVPFIVTDPTFRDRRGGQSDCSLLRRSVE